MSDPSSHANVSDVAVSHVDLVWNVNFEAKTIVGSATHTANVRTAGTETIVFDASTSLVAGLDTASVTVDGESVSVSVGEPRGALGVPVTVPIPESKRAAGSSFSVAFSYKIGEDATALQFLAPEQTAGKTHPYLFSQCQAIHARSLLPCQDSPGAKLTYAAQVTVPAPLTALMSGLADGEFTSDDAAGTRTFRFRQPVAIPSYLIAVVVGELESREIGPRSAVWSEPSLVDAAADEFADTEKFIAAGEELLTPYVWTRYDILCLPPSFPYGGMENPCLTFVTPTLLAGDRSLADVVCHEIAHSWTGNLVTTETWEHFWLNEGCTMWVQRKIMSKLHGEKFFDFDASIGLKALNESIAVFGAENPLTALVPDLSGDIDPDDAFSSVPYEKGFFFLYFLHNLVGGAEAWDPFFRSYIAEFSHKTITTDRFRAYFESYFAGKVDVSGVDWEKWTKTPGAALEEVPLDTTLRAVCNELADKWFADPSAVEGDLSALNTNQRIAFLEQILILQDASPLPAGAVERMEELYKLSETRNAEIRFRWQKICIIAGYEPIVPAVVDFLKEQGRMKYVRPLYRLLFKSSFGKDIALDTFRTFGSALHPIAQKMLANDLGLRDGK